MGLSRLQLAAPVLIGRYDRCDGRGEAVFSLGPGPDRLDLALTHIGDR